MLFLLPADFFFKINVFWKIISAIPSECQRVWTRIRPDIMSDLIWVQTVCKDYQQMTLVGKLFSNKAKHLIICSENIQNNNKPLAYNPPPPPQKKRKVSGSFKYPQNMFKWRKEFWNMELLETIIYSIYVVEPMTHTAVFQINSKKFSCWSSRYLSPFFEEVSFMKIGEIARFCTKVANSSAPSSRWNCPSLVLVENSDTVLSLYNAMFWYL